MQQFMQFVVNHWELWLALIVIIGLLVGFELQHKLSGTKRVSPQQATQLINREEPVLIDVRDKGAFNDGHIIGAINAPLANLQDQANKLIKTKDKPVLLYCAMGNQTNGAAAILKKNGFENLYILQGGIGAWKEASLPLVKD